MGMRKSNSVVRTFSLASSLGGCCDIAMEAIENGLKEEGGKSASIARKRRRLLLCGSSWGGAVALKCVESRNLRPDKMLLIAPALGATGWRGWFWPSWIPESMGDEKMMKNTRILHGSEDETVPVKCSGELKKKFPLIDFVEIEGGDHRMNSHLGLTVQTGDGSDSTGSGVCEKSLEQYIEEMLTTSY